jgi:hypothetical protein
MTAYNTRLAVAAINLKLELEKTGITCFILKVPHSCAAGSNSFAQGLFNGDSQSLISLVRYTARGRQGINTGHKERLIGIDIADAAYHAMVHNKLLYGHFPAP